MSTIAEAAQSLADALGTVDGLRVYTDIAATVDPPGAVIGPPELTWETFNSSAPTEATFLVYLCTAAADQFLEQLWGLVPPVTGALWDATDAVVTGAIPGVWQTGGTDLPCYVITVEVAL